jgi:hypothetical protein
MKLEMKGFTLCIYPESTVSCLSMCICNYLHARNVHKIQVYSVEVEERTVEL